MDYWEQWKRRREKKYQIIYKRGPSTLALVFAGMAIALWGLFTALSSYPVGLYVYYTVAPKTSELLAKVLTDGGKTAQAEAPVVVPVPDAAPVAAVVKDTSLPEGRYLAIPKIGVDTAIWEADQGSYEQALRKGVWRVNDFATPEKTEGKPVILAAHRFGYLEWSQEFREKNSFYNLPKLEGGDQIGITWNQQRYVYRVKRIEEGTKITDYSSDLILYTCKFLVSPVRIFVYAELVK